MVEHSSLVFDTAVLRYLSLTLSKKIVVTRCIKSSVISEIFNLVSTCGEISIRAGRNGVDSGKKISEEEGPENTSYVSIP